MLRTIRAIVLHTIPYQEKGWIIKFYTDELGVQTLLAYGKKGKGRRSASLYQPLTLLEISALFKEKNAIHTLRDARNIYPFKNLYNHPVRTSLGLFIAEVIYKAARHESPSLSLFSFLYDTITALDGEPGMHPDFALLFLLELTRHLGIQPGKKEGNIFPYFHMTEGTFVSEGETGALSLDKDLSSELAMLMDHGILTPPPIPLRLESRRKVLKSLLRYLQIHHPAFGEIQSHLVLEKVLS